MREGAEAALTNISQRHKELQKLEQDVVETSGMTTEIATIVPGQDEKYGDGIVEKS
ncbi:SNARE domain-containing protein [Pochonia chlamydosporia 170]|uniref:SNARE domain-containing protein n=1 Tax=Pochonia chlamydosporia 170 TaxID=1380566 RepID=A0A179F0L6_METCM|nr:SNARE domain-containing protein [Pochonia chlamydosporia 170]OAQ59007.1 SNARE domain-containing protein [Pochonia chlamydosporia 170]